MAGYDPSELEQRGTLVRVRNNDINKAMRKLKKIVLSEGIMQDLRKQEFFESKGTKRKKAKAAAVRRWRKKQQEIAEIDIPVVNKPKQQY